MPTETFPLDLMKPHFLAKVPETVRCAPAKGTHTESYNIASWLVVNYNPGQPVALVLSFTDEKGERAVIVDEVREIGSLNLMLSGRVDLEVKGKIRDMAVHCTGLNVDNHIRVDELFVQPVVQEAQVKAG